MKTADQIRALIPTSKLSEAEEIEINIGYGIALNKGNYGHKGKLSPEIQERYRQIGFEISEDETQIFIIVRRNMETGISVPAHPRDFKEKIELNLEREAKLGNRSYDHYNFHRAFVRQYEDLGFKMSQTGNKTTFEW